MCVVGVGWHMGWQRQRQVKTRGETGRETSAASSQQSAAGQPQAAQGTGGLSLIAAHIHFRDFGIGVVIRDS